MEVCFRDTAGRVATDPTALLAPTPVVDLAALALLFTAPALYGEFYPASVWRGISRHAPVPGTTVPGPVRRPFPALFSRVVDELTADAAVLGVKLSGGLDSLAVLTHAAAVARGRRVVAVTVALTDDRGICTADTTAALIAALGLDVEHVVVDPADVRGVRAPWSPLGPRLDALPHHNAAANQAAATRGVEVLLNGDGADEALGVPRFATAAIAAAHGPRAAVRYLRDVAGTDSGTTGEALAVCARLVPAGVRARAYWAVTNTEPAGGEVLTDAYRPAAQRWARQWVEQAIRAHAATARSWCEADAWDALWPHDRLLDAGPVPERSPFLDPAVLATGADLARRYDAALPTAYQRCKARVVSLFTPTQRPVLPASKQYFAHALADRGRPAARLAIAAGLLDPVALARCTDPAVHLMVTAVEDWLRGALDRGAHLTGGPDDPPPARRRGDGTGFA